MPKKNIHPKYHPQAKMTCACGSEFNVGSTVPEIHVEICSACHPFYTGKQKYIDTAGRLERFNKMVTKSKAIKETKKTKVKKESAKEKKDKE
ncbi:MAG: 50S ribosomal protein L31 [Patescibacteria group bacterium]|nr:50S ribosomal protein L31 [Patescibacteria group bacterium]MDD5164222.1 50S ribosomal protein L31 [Patescibacteria group bacterium]MDD5534640.1 50S ribosomal protein L31 [Patescibacteria group bacterium]